MLNEKGVTRVQWIALYYLGKNNNVNQRDLAKLMNIKESTIARLIDRMEREKLVIRKKNQSDKRVINIILTQKGKETRIELLPEGEKFNELVSTGIKEDELEIFMNVLHKMVSNVSKHNI
ncbi:MarR family transcriptional regulator [Senegalia massiliensis]|uniref:MarR family transcriptional regulator n=1 Tax=Senegalia massiliensis TaxID=1720316 RepID=A0A845R4L2_9CLOT|nr:MarR family transcriptional regulator [Senegalia massiliensis]